MPERSCSECAHRTIYERHEWLHVTCPKWRYPYEKGLFYDSPCELYEERKEENDLDKVRP